MQYDYLMVIAHFHVKVDLNDVVLRSEIVRSWEILH
jgi:hypothetical protein